MKDGYERLIDWIEDNVDLNKAGGYEEGYEMIYEELGDPEDDKGAYKVLGDGNVRSELEDMMFGGVISDKFEGKEPSRPQLVKDEEEWREREKKNVQRVNNTGRMIETLRNFSEKTEKRNVVSRLAEEFDRAETTITRDLTSLRNVGFLEQVERGIWKITDDGEEAMEDWS